MENRDKNIEILIEELGNLPEIQLPKGFHNEVMAKIRQEAGRQKARRRRPVYRAFGTLAAAAAIISPAGR